MGAAPRLGHSTRAAVEALLVDPTQELTALEVCAAAGVAAGSLHPQLARLEGMGWVESRWDDVDPERHPGPPRRRYRLTGVGASLGRAAVERGRRPARVRWRPVAGQP